MAKNNSPKQDVRLAAREQAAAQRAAELKKDRRNRIIVISILVLAVLALVGGVFWINKQGEAKPLADTAAPANTTDTGGISFGAERVAGADNGPDAAKLNVYFDFSCSYCGIFDVTNAPAINEMLEAGDVTLVLQPVAILNSPFSAEVAGATAYLADQAPEHVLDFVNAVFRTNPSGENGPPSNEQLQSLAESLGVDSSVASEMFNGDWDKWISAATDDAVADESLQNDDGGFGTPTIMLNDEKLGAEYDWTVEGQLQQAVADANAK